MTSNRSKSIRTIALLGGGVVAGVIGASATAAGAQSTSSAAPSSTTASSTPSRPDGRGPGAGNETTVTGTRAATLKANALKKVPGATVEAITTEDAADPSGAAYEVHLTKADGTRATLLFKADLSYLSTETGRGHGGPGGHGGGAGETAVTGARAAALKAAALKQVPGATVDEVSTDSGDAAYEVHLTKADKSEVTVKFDKNLAFVAVEDGRGK